MGLPSRAVGMTLIVELRALLSPRGSGQRHYRPRQLPLGYLTRAVEVLMSKTMEQAMSSMV